MPADPKHRRIPFKDALALAIRRNQKSETRRLVDMSRYDYIGPRDGDDDPTCWGRDDADGEYWYLQSPPDDPGHDIKRPYYPGDIMDVCEALVPVRYDIAGPDYVHYRADRNGAFVGGNAPEWRWKVQALPARYCPAWAVRTHRLITSVHPERLTEITDAGAVAEGVSALGWEPTRQGFIAGFRELHGLAADADPWVWVIRWAHGDVPAPTQSAP